MVTTAPSNLIGYEKYEVGEETREKLSLSMVIKFWIATVNIFGALYEVMLKSVYSRIDKANLTPQEAQKIVKAFNEVFPGTVPFTTTSLFEEGKRGAHDFCREVERTMNGGSALDNWRQSWTLRLLSKNNFDNTETKLLTLGMILTTAQLEVHQGWIGDDIPSTIITDAWLGTGKVFGVLWIHDTVIEEVGSSEGKNDVHDYCREVERTINGGFSLDNWIQS